MKVALLTMFSGLSPTYSLVERGNRPDSDAAAGRGIREDAGQ